MRLIDQVRDFRINEWLTKVELEEIRRNILMDGEGNQKINEISMIEERIQNENGPMKPVRLRHVNV